MSDCKHTHTKGYVVIDGVRWLTCYVCKAPVVKTPTVIH